MTEPNLHSGFGRTYRTLAEKETDPEKRRLLESVASQLEVAFDDAGNTAAIALWQTTERLLEQIGNTNTMFSALMEAVASFRQESAAAQAALLAATKDGAARLGKLEKSQTVLAGHIKELDNRLALKRAWLERHDADIAKLNARVFEFDIPEEERKRMIVDLMEMITEWPHLRPLLAELRGLLAERRGE